MAGAPNLSRLRRLIDHHLRRHAVNEAVALTKEGEKSLLVSLSKVLREVQRWTSELDACSDEDHSRGAGESVVTSEVSETKLLVSAIVGDLMQVLTTDNQHVHHLLGNVLLATSELLFSSRKDWTSYVHAIFTCAELSLKGILISSITPTRPVERDLNCNTNTDGCVLLLKPKLQKAQWSTVAGLFRVLRCIWKFLKKDDNNQLVMVFLNLLSSFVLDIPWNSLDNIFVGSHIANKGGVSIEHLNSKVAVQRPELTFLGYFVQLLCSVVEKIQTMIQCGSLVDNLLPYHIIDKVPQLFLWCLGKQEEFDEGCASIYFRHKLLMLMIRLSSFKTEVSVLILWLKLLHGYFEDLLLETISTPTYYQDESLEGSPFIAEIFDGESHSPHAHHLKRQANFLFLRCTFGLINQEGDTNKECGCATIVSCSNSDIDYCSRRKGFLELQKWLQDNIGNIFLDNQPSVEECLNFASSFLHLYVNEDDLLFAVLLQLLTLPSQGVQKCKRLNWTISLSNEQILRNLSNIFDPITLFHLFLQQIHYDHAVLLDYLISGDTGVSCAKYLLRSLRLICDSWQAFTEFPSSKDGENTSSAKRTKIATEYSESQGEAPLTPNVDGMLLLFTKGGEKHQEHRHKSHRTRGEHFDKAEDCLLSLRCALQGLQKKQLFPYNPKVLLRRLTEFQELCSQQEQ